MPGPTGQEKGQCLLVGWAEDEEGAGFRHGHSLLLQLQLCKGTWPRTQRDFRLIFLIITCRVTRRREKRRIIRRGRGNLTLWTIFQPHDPGLACKPEGPQHPKAGESSVHPLLLTHHPSAAPPQPSCCPARDKSYLGSLQKDKGL